MKADAIGSLARQALLAEIDVWPKPGLVSRVDSGSHSDMDATLLQQSVLALEPYFVQLAQAGARGADMLRLRQLGVAAETAMLTATGGVNTHRGAIFGLGLLCAAAGAAAASSMDQTTGSVLGNIVRERWGAGIQTPPPPHDSHGALVARQYGVGGARACAAAGFSILYQVGWPALRKGRQLAPGDENAAAVQCCFALISAIADTNLLYRGGLDGLMFCRALADAFIQRGGVGRADWHSHGVEAHRAFVARRLSPGGAADLLAMTLFVDAYEAAQVRARQRCTAQAVLV